MEFPNVELLKRKIEFINANSNYVLTLSCKFNAFDLYLHLGYKKSKILVSGTVLEVNRRLNILLSECRLIDKWHEWGA